MALGTSNISISGIQSEMGNSINKLSLLSKDPSVQKFSFYAPGNLSVDASKNTVLTPFIDKFKIGEFRKYYQNPQEPGPGSIFTHDYGPGGSTTSFIFPWFPEQMNIKEYASFGDYITQKYYLSTSDRINETNVHKTQINSITFGIITPIPGHSRNTTLQAGSTQTPVTNSFPTGGLSKPNDIVYAYTYISDQFGVRKINLNTKISDGYTDMTFHEIQNPKIISGGSVIPPPSGYTVSLVEIFTASTPLCNANTDITMTFGSSNVTFYMHVRSIGTDNRITGYSSADVNLYLDGSVYTMFTGSLSHTANLYINYTLPDGTKWAYDDIGTVKVENETLSGSLSSACP